MPFPEQVNCEYNMLVIVNGTHASARFSVARTAFKFQFAALDHIGSLNLGVSNLY